MQLCLPHDKLLRIKELITTWLSKNQLLVVQCRRTFVSRMYATAAKVQQLDFYTRLNKDFHSDLYRWNTFLMSWNGLCLLRSTSAKADFCIQTDASGSWGCGAYLHGRWFLLPRVLWPKNFFPSL